jgi:hypothetical protein
MLDFVRAMFGPGMLVYSILLALVTVFWLKIIVGLVEINWLDGLLGTGDWLSLDATESVTTGSSGVGSEGQRRWWLDWLNIGTVPLSILGSLTIMKMWILAYLCHRHLSPEWQAAHAGLGAAIVQFGVLGTVSLCLTGLTARPLRGFFEHTPIRGGAALVGQICVVKTSEIKAGSGQAEVAAKGPSLLLQVYCREGSLRKGERARIVAYDEVRDRHEIRPLHAGEDTGKT